MKKILLMAVAAGALFACNKQEPTDAENVKGENTVTLSIKQEVMSKGVTDQKGDPEYAVIGSAKIYFINASGTSVYQRELTATEVANLTNTSSTAGGKTIEINGVPSSATTLFFLANIQTSAGTGFPAVEGTGSAAARLRIDKLQGDAANVPMSGQSGAFAPAGVNQFTASVTITPLVARIELGQVTCQSLSVSSDITDYKLSGVFINNVRPYVLLSGAPYLVGAPIDIKSQGGWGLSGWENYFTPVNTVFPYYVGGSPTAPGDWGANAMVNYCTPQGNPALIFYPDATHGSTSTDPADTKVWAYQVCPSTTVLPTEAADVPHIILKLTEVDYVAPELTNPVQYVTVTKYTNVNSGAAITGFQRGNVYRIENLTFSHVQATDKPYDKDIVVTATVSVAKWVVNFVEPDWN